MPAALPTVSVPPFSYDRPRYRPVQRDPRFCFHHPQAAAELTCAACGEKFCPACVVTFRKERLCGPCKNFRVRRIQRPRDVSVMAILSPLVAVIAGGFWAMVLGVSAAGKPERSTVLTLWVIGMLPQLIAMTMGALALQKMEQDPRVTGKGMAITGMVSAVVCAVATAQITLLALKD
jgi:energy-converting hydrogenase Eha subunit A